MSFEPLTLKLGCGPECR